MSLFSGMSVSSAPEGGAQPPPPAADSSGEGGNAGGFDFTGLSGSGGDAGGFGFTGMSGGGGAPSAFNFVSDEAASASMPSGGGMSAFNFMNDDAGASAAAPPSGGLSAFNFIGSEDAGAASGGSGSAFGFMNAEAAPAPEASDSTSMFSFMNSPSVEPAPVVTTTDSLLGGLNMMTSAPAPAPVPAPSLPSVDLFAEPAAPRKKTRKAMLPGAAGRAAEAAADSMPAPGSMPAPDSFGSEGAGTELPKPDPPAEQPAPPPPPAPAAEKVWGPSSAPPPPPPAEPEPAAPPVRSLLAGLTQAASPPIDMHTPPPPSPAAVFSPVASSTPVSPQPAPPVTSSPQPLPPPAAAAAASFEPPARIPEPVAQEPAEDKIEQAFNLEGAQQWLEVRLASSMEEHRGLLEQQASCLARSQRMTSDVASLRQKLAATEAEQNRLCDAEQFEEAEALESTIQQLKDAITRRLEEVAGTSRQMETQARSLLNLTRDRESLAEQTLERMQSLQNEGEEAVNEMEERTDRRLASESARLESEKKRMELACSHLNKDSENLDEEKQQLSEAIEQQTNIHVQERDQAVSERGLLDEELRELQRLLELKMKQRKTLTEVVDSCEIRIASIKSKFEKQLSRLDGKQKRLEEARREVDTDAQQVDQMALELNRERKMCTDGAADKKRQLTSIRSESRKLRGLRRLMSRHLRMRSRWQKLLEPHQEMLNQARLRWEASTSDCLTLASSLAAREAEGSKLRSQLDGIRIQMPTLEAEKKVAVASRSFKEAGRISQELARREEDRKSAEAALESLQSELTDHRERLAGSRQAEEAAQAGLMEAEAKGGAEELRILQRQICDLDSLRKSSSMGATERILFEEEERVFRSSRAHLAEKFSIDLDSLEEIPAEDSDDGAAPSEEDAAVCSSPPVELADEVAQQASADSLEAAQPESPVVFEDLGTLRQRRDDLETLEAECEEAILAAEKAIEQACESDQFDEAEELENDRQRREEVLQDCRRKRAALLLQIEEAEKAEVAVEPPREAAAAVDADGIAEEAPAEEAEEAATEVAAVDASASAVVDEAAEELPAVEEGEEVPVAATAGGFSFVTGAAPEEPANDTAEEPSAPAHLDAAAEESSTPPPAPSGFSFVGSAPIEAANEDSSTPPPAPTGFSFVGSAPTEAADEAPSGFAFVGGEPTAEVSELPAPAEEDAPVSGFSFIGGGGEASTPTDADAAEGEASPAAASEEAF